MEETESTQETIDAGPQPTTQRRAPTSITQPKVGLSKNIRQAAMKKLSTGYFERRRLLTVPQEILDAHPDKHFCYLNMNKLEKNGFWNEKGYELFKASEFAREEDATLLNKFNRSPDGFIHRNEMVLAWIPKEDYELQKMEADVVRGRRDITEIISRHPDLKEFNPHAKRVTAQEPFPLKENQEAVDG